MSIEAFETQVEINELNNQLKKVEKKKSWDWGIASLGLSAAILSPYVMEAAPPLVKLVEIFGPSMVFAIGVTLTFKRDAEISFIKGQINGIERQAQRTVSLQNPTTS